MTNDDKKKRLKAYIHANEKISDLVDEIVVLKSKVEKVTPTLSDMPNGGGMSDKSCIIDTYLDMINDLEREVCILRNIRYEVEHLISTIDDWTVERVMRLRYIDNLRWEDICCRVNYSWRQVHYLHADGLNQIEFDECIELH